MAADRPDGLAHRTVGDDVYAAEWGHQCRRDLFLTSDPGDACLRAICLRMGLSYIGASGPVCMASEKDRPQASSVQIAAADFCPVGRRVVYVCAADAVTRYSGAQE